MVNISVYENFYNNQSVKGWGKGEQPILFCGNIPLEIGLKTMFYGVLAVDDYIFITQSLFLNIYRSNEFSSFSVCCFFDLSHLIVFSYLVCYFASLVHLSIFQVQENH